MKIREYYYNDDTKRLYIEFSTEDDGDRVYRILELSYNEIEYNSPRIINEEDIINLDVDFVVDLLIQYIQENELPEEIIL
jgi:hypothetical protein